jgi:hypothetical protein
MNRQVRRLADAGVRASSPITRRRVGMKLLGLAALGLMTQAGSCINGQGGIGAVSQTIITDIASIAARVTEALPSLKAGMPAAAYSAIETAATDIAAGAAAVQKAIGGTGQSSGVQQFLAGVAALFGAIAPFASLVPGPFGAILSAISLVLPLISGAFGLMTPSVVTNPPAALRPVLAQHLSRFARAADPIVEARRVLRTSYGAAQ